MSVPSRRRSRALAVAATAGACLAVGAVPATSALADDDTASSRRPKTVHVTGLLTLKDARTGEYAATGDLVGTWSIPPSRATDYYSSATTVLQKGSESFEGCLVVGKDRCGTLNSEYISWTYLKANGRLISGGCTHALTGGTKAFRGVRGLIMMTDTPIGDEVNTVYQGEVILDAAPREASTPVPEASLTTTSAKTSAKTTAKTTAGTTAGTAVAAC